MAPDAERSFFGLTEREMERRVEEEKRREERWKEQRFQWHQEELIRQRGTCKDCHYSVVDPYSRTFSPLICRRNPPQLGSSTGERWPSVENNNWCGEFRREEGLADRVVEHPTPWEPADSIPLYEFGKEEPVAYIPGLPGPDLEPSFGRNYQFAIPPLVNYEPDMSVQIVPVVPEPVSERTRVLRTQTQIGKTIKTTVLEGGSFT